MDAEVHSNEYFIQDQLLESELSFDPPISTFNLLSFASAHAEQITETSGDSGQTHGKNFPRVRLKRTVLALSGVPGQKRFSPWALPGLRGPACHRPCNLAGPPATCGHEQPCRHPHRPVPSSPIKSRLLSHLLSLNKIVNSSVALYSPAHNTWQKPPPRSSENTHRSGNGAPCVGPAGPDAASL